MSREDDLREIERLMGGKKQPDQPQPKQPPAQPVYSAPRRERKVPPAHTPPRSTLGAQRCIEEGREFVRYGVPWALGLLALNIAVLAIFNWNLWALYWLNIGFIVIRPFVKFFDQFEYTVIDLDTFNTWTETRGWIGAIIGLVVLLLGTWAIKSWLLDWLPPYTFMMEAIIIAAAVLTSGRTIFNCARNAVYGAIIWRAGKREIKDPHATPAVIISERLKEKFGKQSLIICAAIGLIMLTVILAQFVQVWVMTPKLEKTLDPIAMYEQADNALPFSDATVQAAVRDGGFSNYSTEYNLYLASDLSRGGVTGYFEQHVSYNYNLETDQWEINARPANVTVQSVNVKGKFVTTEGIDGFNPDKVATITLDITSLNQTKASGRLTVMIDGEVVYNPTFTGTVEEQNGDFKVAVKLSRPRNPVFGIGKDEYAFTYYAYNNTIVSDHDYKGTFIKQ